MRFNQSQSRAIDHFQGPSLVLAGPGSGKTAVITYRVKNLIEKYHISPSKILVLTFSKAAAKEMEERFFALHTFHSKEALRPAFGTFHAFFLSVLRKYSQDNSKKILSGEEKKLLLMEEAIPLHLYQEEDSYWDTLIHEISRVKCGIPSEEMSSILPQKAFLQLFEAYEAALSKRSLLDFDDILTRTLELLSLRKDILSALQDHFSFFLIDEFQDVSPAQYDIMKLLAEKERNLFVVGDDDQSIYAFRGSSSGIMKQFLSDYPDAQRILLNVNYRCSPAIVRASLQVISKNPDRFRKEICCFQKESAPEAFTIQEEENLEKEYHHLAESIVALLKNGCPPDGIAVLIRGTTDLSLLLRTLQQRGIPIKDPNKSDSAFDSFLCRDLTIYMKAAKAFSEKISADRFKIADLLRIMNRPSRFLSKQSLINENKEATIHALFASMRQYYQGNTKMLRSIRRFEEDLGYLAACSSYAAICYIWNRIGYKKYIKEYCSKNQQDHSVYEKILSVLLEASKEVLSFQQWEELLEKKKAQKKGGQSGIDIKTMHASKGLEYDIVFLPDLNEGLVPHKKALTPEQIQEERRLFYVAMTRARRELHLSFVRDYHSKKATRSRFLDCFF